MHNVVASWVRFPATSRYNAMASGVGPHISIILGPAAGGAAYSPALTDFVIMVDKTSHMFITGPDVIKSVTGEDVDMESLGGARSHNTTTGTASYMAADEEDAIEFAKELLEFLPLNNLAEAPVEPSEQRPKIELEDEALNELIPDSASAPYDMTTLIEQLLDEGHFLQLQA